MNMVATAKARCPWLNLNNSLYVRYHDEEWGRPVYDDQLLFEMLILEGAQAGLSWETVLNKRQRYREVFYGFDVKKLTKFDRKEIEKALLDSGIVRNRLKVESVPINARAFLLVQKEFGSFSNYLWGFSDGKVVRNKIRSIRDYVTSSDLSDRISKDLKRRGFKFVGTTIIYAYLQAVGIVNDHSRKCYLSQDLAGTKSKELP